jgi:hypothetical protein
MVFAGVLLHLMVTQSQIDLGVLTIVTTLIAFRGFKKSAHIIDLENQIKRFDLLIFTANQRCDDLQNTNKILAEQINLINTRNIMQGGFTRHEPLKKP